MSGKRVLLIGPDRPVRAAIAGALLKAGHEVRVLDGAERARDEAPPDVVLCLTGLVSDGPTADVRGLRERYPSARRVRVGRDAAVLDDPDVRCLSWPLDMESLRQTLRE